MFVRCASNKGPRNHASSLLSVKIVSLEHIAQREIMVWLLLARVTGAGPAPRWRTDCQTVDRTPTLPQKNV